MIGHPPEVEVAAAELGVIVPGMFIYQGCDEHMRHHAFVIGGPEELSITAAILGRLDGKPVAQCLREMPADFRPRRSGRRD